MYNKSKSVNLSFTHSKKSNYSDTILTIVDERASKPDYYYAPDFPLDERTRPM